MRIIATAGHVDHGGGEGVDLGRGILRAGRAQGLDGVDVGRQQGEDMVALFIQRLVGAGLGLDDQTAAGPRHLTLERGVDAADGGGLRRGDRFGHRLTFIGFSSMSMSS